MKIEKKSISSPSSPEVRTHPELQKLVPRNYLSRNGTRGPYPGGCEPVRVRPTTMKAAKEEVEEVEPKTVGRPEMGLKEEARMLLMHSDDETWPDQKKKKWHQRKKTNKRCWRLQRMRDLVEMKILLS